MQVCVLFLCLFIYHQRHQHHQQQNKQSMASSEHASQHNRVRTLGATKYILLLRGQLFLEGVNETKIDSCFC